MRALTLQQTNVAAGEQPDQASCGRSLSSNYCPPNLENKFLTQTSLMTTQSCALLANPAAQPSSCPAFQPSSLSSTTSSLLFPNTFTPFQSSPLLSTQNKLLTSNSLRPSCSLACPLSNDSLLTTTMSSGALVSRFANAFSILTPDVRGEQKEGDGGQPEEGEEISEAIRSSFEETTEQHSEASDMSSEEQLGVEETDAVATMELQATESENQEQTDMDLDEEFPELDRGSQKSEEELKEKKYFLLNAVCCSLVMKTTPPGQKGWKSRKSIWFKILTLSSDISASDPEFLLKVALYTRQKLNIRITANFLLALAASLEPTKPHVRRYFCAAVQLPSDWLEVVRIYTKCFKRSLPMCLKKAMADKFKQFNEYQLAKYNTRKHRCKHSSHKPKGKKPTANQLKQWALKLRSDPEILKKFLQSEEKKAVVDKKQSEFSMKKLIQKLHIKEPAEYVMAILGKKYPADHKSFTRSGLKGEWERERSGQRMKLKVPQTWERLLSLEGNKAATWEKLIDSKSLPFMAMLRNLRNMITQGISEYHHSKILKRLTDKKAVIESRQFPFRFLAAYKVILQILPSASAVQPGLPATANILKDILKKIPKGKRFSHLQWEETNRTRTKVTLSVPFIYRMYQQKKAQLLKASKKVFTVGLLERYCKALETAIQISCRYNVPPLPGRTVVLLSASMSHDAAWSQKQDFCLPPNPETQEKKKKDEQNFTGRKKNREGTDELTPSKEEAAALLALMISSSAEDCQLCIFGCSNGEEVKLKSDVLLENVTAVGKQMKDCQEKGYDRRDSNFFNKLFTKDKQVNNVIVLTDGWSSDEVFWAVNNYKNSTNHKVLVVDIYMDRCYRVDSQMTHDSDFVTLTGFNEQILRFVAERGSSRLLEHVEHLDKLYNIPPAGGAKDPQATNDVLSIPPTPKLRWQSVRLFVSSTFRDMHSERDVLVQSVFPELRRRAAPHRLHLQEVELRWGVTEEESERATELCLSEVCRSQMLVAILGERYGTVPPKPVLPDLPQYSWLASAPTDLSITEMEIRQFEALYPDDAHQRMFCYFRDPNIIKSVPVAWRSEFSPESKHAEHKMATLKKTLLDNDAKVTENYSCEWGGVVDGKPSLKNLEDFGKAVLEDLWTAVKNLFVDKAEEQEVASELSEQEVHQGALQRQFFGRSKLLSAAVEIVEVAQARGQMMVVEGGPGEGKTLFMAALAEALTTGTKSRNKLACRVISYATAASQSAHSMESLLRCLVQWLRKMKDSAEDSAEESPLPRSYKDLLVEFQSTLSDLKMQKPLVLLIDGVDLIRDGRGHLSCDWIPQSLPKGVCLVVSMTSKSPLLQTLVQRSGTVQFSLGQLTVVDRKEIVRKELDAFGKKLSDSAFNNQLQMLIMKKGAVSPLYLHLACEDLRNFASFDKLKETLLGLPQSLSQLVQFSLERLCSHYSGMPGLRWALAVLAVSATGLKERDLFDVLNTCNCLMSHGGRVTWEEVLQMFRKPKGRIPMTTFTRIVQNLQSLIGASHGHHTDNLLTLTNPEVKRAFEDLVLPAEADRSRAHLLLAAHLWTRADPQGRDTFFHCEVNSVMHLPRSLIESGQLEAVQFLLSSFYFLYANVRNGLLQHLLETYELYNKEFGSSPSSGFSGRLVNCLTFLQRHAAIIASWPALFIQEALRDPPLSEAHSWAKGLVRKGGIRVVECEKSNISHSKDVSVLMSTLRSEPSCFAVSPDKLLMAVGTRKGTLHFLHAQTGQEVKSLVSSCDGISSCVFLKDGRVVTTSFDGRFEVWDVENGCRTAVIDGHTNTITASNVSEDKKHLVTVSLDFMLKVWSSAKSHEVASLPSNSPMNCVTFDPEDRLLAAGCWNGDVIVWNWLQNKSLPILRGHQHSVRSLSFSSSSSSSSSMLCSGSMSGEVRVWSVPTSTCVGCFQAHAGATEALAFLERGNMLLTAGSDHMLRLWSGGLGRSVATLKNYETQQEPPQKKMRSEPSVPAALCVAVSGDYVVVGYHNDSIKIYSLNSGEKIQSIDYISLSIICMMWVVVDTKKKKKKEKQHQELLVISGNDKRMRVYKEKQEEEGMMGGLKEVGMFSCQFKDVLAMAQSSTYLATASDDCSIVLWPLSKMAEDPSLDPEGLLQGHRGGVTCLAFSPDGKQLLSGGKDQDLMLWDVNSSPAVLSKSLPHAHRDWITGCVWTPDTVISSSNDGRLCFWDLAAAQCLKEICSGKSALTSVCCLGRHVMAGCAEGELHIWDWETSAEIGHISAHKQRINHCLLLPNTDKKKEVSDKEMTVLTASDDGTVKIWKPLQVEHFFTLQGHSGAIQGLVLNEELKNIYTVSADRSVRSWTWSGEFPSNQSSSVTALSYSENGEMFLAGYESGLLEVWRHNTVVSQRQMSENSIVAACFMPQEQLAVSSMNVLAVDVWKLVWNEQSSKASLVKLRSYTVEENVTRLIYCSSLMGVDQSGKIIDLASNKKRYRYNHMVNSWERRVHIHGVIRNDEKSLWLVGDTNGIVNIGFLFSMGPTTDLNSAFSTVSFNEKQEEEEEEEEEEDEEEEEGEEEGKDEEEEQQQGEEAKDKGVEEEEVEDEEVEDEDEEVEDEEEEDDDEEVEEEEEEDDDEEVEDEEEEVEDEEVEDEEEEVEDEDEEVEEEEVGEEKVEDKEEQDKNDGEEQQAEEQQQDQEEAEKEDEEPEEDEEEAERKKCRSHITAITLDKEFVVCGDVEGNMWFNQPSQLMSWSNKKPAHSERITQLRLTETTIISASQDRTLKLWDRNTKKQVGMFVCKGPVVVLEVNPTKPTELLCGDGDGLVYVLTWNERTSGH